MDYKLNDMVAAVMDGLEQEIKAASSPDTLMRVGAMIGSGWIIGEEEICMMIWVHRDKISLSVYRGGIHGKHFHSDECCYEDPTMVERVVKATKMVQKLKDNFGRRKGK